MVLLLSFSNIFCNKNTYFQNFGFPVEAIDISVVECGSELHQIVSTRGRKSCSVQAEFAWPGKGLRR